MIREKRPLSVLEEQIERTRYDLHELAKKFDFLTPIVLAKSIELDILLNQYHRLLNKKKSSP